MDLKTESYIKSLDDLKNMISNVDDEDVKNSLVKLFCVRTAGLLEVFIKTRISEYSKGKVPKEISRFLTTKFKDITNLKCSKLKDVLNSFSQEWAEKFDEYITTHEQEKDSLDSLITQRHNIAHGQSSNIGESSACQYFNDVISVVKYLDVVIR